MKMTRPAPQPACARVRQLVAVWLGCILWMSVGTSARAQVRSELERALTVTRELPGCVSAAALRARTAQYLDRVEPLSELTIEVDLQVPQFRVLRDGTLLAERRFLRAPADCSERRDALALAVAIAIEQVAGDAAAESGTPQPSEAASTRTVSAAEQPSQRGSSEQPRSGAPSAGNAPVEPGQRASSAQPRSGAPSAGNAPVEPNPRAPSAAASAGELSVEPAANTRTRAAEPSGEDEIEARARTPSGQRAAETEREPSPLLAADRGLTRTRELTSSGRPRTLVSVMGGGAVLFEALPTAAAAFSAGAELALLPALRIGLSGLFSLPVSSPFQGGTVSARMFGAQLTGCANAPLFAGLLLHGCVGAVGGVIHARGDDFALNLSDHMGWIAGLVRARLEFPAAGLVAAGVYADARANLLRPELQASVTNMTSEPARTRAVGLVGAALGVELIVRLH